MDGETVVQQVQVSAVRTVIHAPGLRELSSACALMDKEARSSVQKRFRTSAEPIADRARQIASTFAATGQFAGSISIQGGARSVFLRSTDPGAGPIEFARPGAVALRGPNIGKRIGVPTGQPPRALIPAIEEGTAEVAEKLTDAIEQTWLALTAGVR